MGGVVTLQFAEKYVIIKRCKPITPALFVSLYRAVSESRNDT